jgi:glycosyltransferase involved in cell wall biosynthesis
MINKISIIIPLYNLDTEEKLNHFRKLISSIIANIRDDETYLIHELIIVDDSTSSKNSVEIISILQKIENYCNVKYFKNEINRGQSFSRNKGSSIATGDYFHFIDQDDLIDDNFYYFLFFGKSDDCDIIMGDCISLTDLKTSFYGFLARLMLNSATNFAELKLLLLNNICNSPGQFLIRRSKFREVNGFPDLRNKGSDDFAFYLRLIDIPHKFYFINQAKFFYRTHEGQSSKILNMRASEINSFEGLNYSFFSIMYWVKLVKLSILFGPIRILFYKIFFHKFK